MTENSVVGRRKPGEIVDGEVVGELIDDTLMNLPDTEGAARPSIESPRVAPEAADPGRRQFLTRIAIGGAAALALGGSAALLLNKRDPSSVVILPNGSSADGASSLDVAQLVQQISDLQAQLTSVTGERDQLQTQVNMLNSQVQQIKPLLDEAQALNALWASLDEVGLDSILQTALSVLGGLFAGVKAVAALIQPAIADIKSTLDFVTTNLPKPEAGIRWLSVQVTSLGKAIDDLAKSIETAVQPVQPYAQLVTNFVDWVLNQLPFNIGAKARAGLQGMQSIVGTLPTFLSGISSDVLNPLASWFGSDPLQSLKGIVFSPVIDKLIIPTQDMLNKISSLNDTYESDLNMPGSDALQKRETIRGQIRELEARISSHLKASTFA